jgi:dihydroxyacid dehydratase/phosphogluconate dehydratase
VQDGDHIAVDMDAGRLDLIGEDGDDPAVLSPAHGADLLAKRLVDWRPAPRPRGTSVLDLYRATAGSTATGAVMSAPPT